ncbi:MAG: transglutaminase family protein [Fuerstiella sp.]
MYAQTPTTPAENSDGPVGEPDTDSESTTATRRSIETLAADVRKSLVIVRAVGRDGRDAGHGTGFVISRDGLIATARHVIGDRRPVRIELADGRQLPVTHVHAVTEAVDLAVLQVDSGDLTPLPLGVDADTKAGQSVVTVGYPRTTQYSVYSGIVSGRQQIEGISMLKLAMTVEPGSSGEPIVDRRGRVIGVVTLKSTSATDVGFAVPINHLKMLLEDPAPIPVSRWMTIGALDDRQWQTVWGANWRQRASRIMVDGYGDSFGGRSLCVQATDTPQIPFELQVDVRLDDESGAAGLAWHWDGGHRHYGFYPSAGKVRLTRFNGPDLNSWTILHNEPHPAYRAGDWNTFKVRIEQDRVLCFVNDQLAVESTDDEIAPGRIGLATFRGTSAGFRRFLSGPKIPSSALDDTQLATLDEILQNVTAVRPASPEVIADMQPFARQASRYLEQEARELELRASHLRQLSADVHAATVRKQILAALGRPPAEPTRDSDTSPAEAPSDETTAPDLLKAALLIAVLDNEELEPQSYLDRVDHLAREVRQNVAEEASEKERLAALDHLLFEDYGFRGSRFEYYSRSNSYMNEVIDDREGLPIALSVLYMELAQRLDLTVVGLGLPGHFVVRFEPQHDGAEPEIIDAFQRGRRMTREQAEELVRGRGFPLLPEFFTAQTPDQIVKRMLQNLLNLAEAERDNERVLRYLETLVAIDPEDHESRAKRLEIRARTGRLSEAIRDVDWFIEQQPAGTNPARLYELKAELQRQLDQQNP